MNTLKHLVEKLSILGNEPSPKALHIDAMLQVVNDIYIQLQASKYALETPEIATENTMPHVAPLATLQQGVAPKENTWNDEIDALFNANYDTHVAFDGKEPLAPSESIITQAALEDIAPKIINTDDASTEHTQVAPEADAAVPIISETSIENTDYSGINFEFPPQAVHHRKVVTPQPDAEVPIKSRQKATLATQNEAVAAEKISEAPSDVPVIGQSFKAPATPNQKDFRTHIGFNDRYLFLNELFQNNKELMEASISKINNSANLEAAKSWIQQELTDNLNWDHQDTTVQTFYALVEKYFKTT